MKVSDVVLGVRQRAEHSLWKTRMVGGVVAQTRIFAAIRWSGVRVLLREMLKGVSGHSLLFRFHAENEPHRIALLHPHSLLSAYMRRDSAFAGPSGYTGRDSAFAGPSGYMRRAEDRAYSFFELNELIDRIALGLYRRGLGPGSSALLVLKNYPEFFAIQAAIARIGGAAVTASWRSSAPEIEYLATDSGARAVLFDAEGAGVIREIAPRLTGIPRENFIAVSGPAPESEGFETFEELITGQGAAPENSAAAAVVMYTSGTTGKPKGAVRKFPRGTISSALAFLGETPMRFGDVHLVVCPLYHATAFGFASLAFMLGATVIVLPGFRPELFLEAVQRYRVNTTAMVPTMLYRLLELGEGQLRSYDTSSLRAIFTSGAPLPASLARETMNALGDKLYNCYGATETGLVTIASPDDLRASPGTIGRAVPGVEIRLVTEGGREAGEGEVGELYIRSSQLVDGYHNDAEATRRSMLDGFFSVGDLARRDHRGCYHIEGRKRDMIISGGVNVYPAEVEAVLHDHPAIAEGAVVGVPDREWGERVRAFVVRRKGVAATEDDLRTHCRARLAGPKVPRDFVFLDALPRNPTGKVLKRELSQWSTEKKETP